MADDRQGPPQHQPTTTPPQHGIDAAMVSLQTAVEMQKSLGSIEAKLDRLIRDTDKLDDRLGPLEKAVDRVKTGFIVGSTLLTAFLGFAWWAIGDRITSAVHAAITQQTNQQPPSQP